MEITVTTARAAEIVGIGYEGFRSYLKRGLLGSSGLMAPLVHPNEPAPDLSRVRATWKRFGVTDLCLMRLAKQLIDSGLSFDKANGIVSAEDTRNCFRPGVELVGAVLMAWPPHYDFIVFIGDDLRHLPNRLGEIGDTAVLVQMDRIATHVAAALGIEPDKRDVKTATRPEIYAIRAASPADLSPDDCTSFRDLVVAGGEVANNALTNNITNAKALFFLEQAEETLGISALKRPQATYRQRIGESTGINLSAEAFPYELGYIFVRPDARNRKHSHRLVAVALDHVDDTAVFATVRVDNLAMLAALARAGFSPAGQPYAGREGRKIQLLIRPAIRPTEE